MLKLIKNIISLLILLLFTCVPAFATISGISGTVAHDNSVTISGSSFGTKSTVTPLRFDDFEDGTPGENVIWESGSDCNKSKYSTAQTRGQGSQTSHHDFDASNNGVKLCENETEFSTFYLDFWIYIAPKDNYSRNYKVWRMWRDDNLLQTYEQVYCSDNSESALIEVYDSSNSGNISNLYHGQQNSPNSVWKHYQIELVQSTASTADGRVNQWIDGANDAEINEAQITRVSSKTWTQFRLGSYWATDADGLCTSTNTGANIYIDDAYLDTTLARVELIDNATYSLSVHREIQIPTAWAGTGDSITITVNQGSFAESATAWLAVIDSDGDVQGTYEVTIGSAAASGSTSVGTGNAVTVGSGNAVTVGG